MTEEIRYDVFLSHSSQDKPAVEQLARRLTDEAGLRPFLDKWHLVPGEPWQEALEEALDQSRTCAVFIGPRGIGPWENEEVRAAIEQRVAARALRVIPVLLPGAERGKRGRLPAFLTRTTWVEFRESLDDTDAFHRLVAGIKGVPPGRGPGEAVYEGVCPYRGLQVFEEEHAPFFFGREAATEWLVNDLRSSRFLAVVGPSGCGKSSLVRAGLVPALRRGDLPGSETWPLCVFRPGHRPLESLAVALIRLVSPADDPKALYRLMDALATDQRQLHLTTRLILTDAPAEHTIALVVDQFEEIFTLCRDEDQLGPFIDNLLYASAIEGGRTVVVLTMRADFYGKCTVYPDLAARVTDHQMLVSPMVEEELRQAIERPAQLVGLEFEGGLVEALLRDVQAEPGALPLLQHTLLELWERREGHRLTFAAYREIGGTQGAIAHRAESIYAGFDATQQAITRRIMLRLTQPGDGTEDTRRRARKSELLPTGEQAEATEAVIQTLADARLVTTARDMASGEEQVDVSDEALIRGWPRLREWIDEDRAGLRTHRRLTEAAQEWERYGRDESCLYRGIRLAEAGELVATYPDSLSKLERAFIEASIALREREGRKPAQVLARTWHRFMEAARHTLVSKPRSLTEELEQLLSMMSREVDLQEDELQSLVDLFLKRTELQISRELPLTDRLGFRIVPVRTPASWAGLNLPETVPLVVSRHSSIDESVMLELHQVLQVNNLPARVAIFLTLAERIHGRMLTEIAKKDIQTTYAYDIVMLTREDIIAIARSSDPSRQLRSLLLSQVDLISISPFVITGPISWGMFFGRERELREIGEHAENTSFAIVGGRRIGKSSILGRLHRYELALKGFYTLYVDCSPIPDIEAFRNLELSSWRPSPPRGNLNTFGDLLISLPTDQRLVLLLDEVDNIISVDHATGWLLFNDLRAMVNRGRAQVILSGERTLREALQDPTSTLFNFVNEVLLGPLEYRAVEELVTRPMKQLEIELVDEAAIVQRIWNFTSGHPNVVQRLCRRLIERLNEQSTRRISQYDVDAVINNPRFQEEDFLKTYWERATPLEQIISLLIAREARPYHLQAVLDLLTAQGLHPEPEVVKAALDRLVDLRSILKRSQAGYEFAVEAFPLVLTNTTTAEDLLIVLKSQYSRT